NSVVLPAPLGPIMARRSPGWTARVTSSTARRPPKTFETPDRLSAGAVVTPVLAMLAGRHVPVVYGLLQEFLRRVLPELRDGGEGLDHGIGELAVPLLDLPDVDVLDGAAVAVELDRPARRVGNLHLPERGQEPGPVLDVAAHRLDRPGDPAAGGVAGLRVVAGDLPELGAEPLDEPPVRRAVDGRAVDQRADRADRLVPQRRQHELVEARPAADERKPRLQPG